MIMLRYVYRHTLMLWLLVFSHPFNLSYAQDSASSLSRDEDDQSSTTSSTGAASSTKSSVSATPDGSTSMSANATAPSPRLDVVNDMCYRWFHQSTIKKGSLWIDGGIESFADEISRWSTSGPTVLGYNYRMIQIDLTQPFNWTEINITTLVLDKTEDPDSGNMPPQVSNAVLLSGLPEDSRIWLYGGTTYWYNTSFPEFQGPTTQIYSLWSYDTDSQRWDQYDVSSMAPSRPSNGLAAEAPTLGLGFYFNGELDSGSSAETGWFRDYRKDFLEGMVVINTTSQTAANVSTEMAVGNTPRTRGGAAYIPGIGGSGVLAIMGGTYKPRDVPDEWEISDSASFASMDNITIFDVGAYLRNETEQLWYSQNATGDIPGPRAYFCTVLVSTEDSLVHNIYVYAGRGPDNTIYDDVYVLSIPSFTWTKVFGPATSPRFGHTCHQVGDQMITVGGQRYTDLGQQLPCDWETQGVAIFNLSSTQWGDVFKPVESTAPYTVPSQVRDTIKE